MALKGGNFDVNAFVASNPSPYQGGRIPISKPAAAKPGSYGNDLPFTGAGAVVAAGNAGGVQNLAGLQQPAALTAEQIYAQQLAQQRAQQEAQRGQLRGEIGGGIQNLQNVYSQLFGDVTGAATSQRQALEQRFGRETQALGEQFNEELPSIGKAYGARGIYDSSYRMDAEEKAQRQFQRQLQDLAAQREADAAKIGQYVAEQQARIQAEQDKLGTISGRLGQTQDINDLIQLRNQIEGQIADTRALRAGAMSQQQLMQRFQQLAPATDRLSQLQGILTNIIQGAAPSALKRATAQQIIGSAGLSQQEQDLLQQQINQIA